MQVKKVRSTLDSVEITCLTHFKSIDLSEFLFPLLENREEDLVRLGGPQVLRQNCSIHLKEASWKREVSLSGRREVPSKSNPSYFFVDQKNFYAKGISNEFKTEQK